MDKITLDVSLPVRHVPRDFGETFFRSTTRSRCTWGPLGGAGWHCCLYQVMMGFNEFGGFFERKTMVQLDEFSLTVSLQLVSRKTCWHMFSAQSHMKVGHRHVPLFNGIWHSHVFFPHLALSFFVVQIWCFCCPKCCFWTHVWTLHQEGPLLKKSSNRNWLMDIRAQTIFIQTRRTFENQTEIKHVIVLISNITTWDERKNFSQDSMDTRMTWMTHVQYSKLPLVSCGKGWFVNPIPKGFIQGW